MRHRKKTRTRYTDRTAGKAARRPSSARAQVAAEAARIIATEGQLNYQAAKKKAAQRIGASDRKNLPSNVEVEESLRSYLSLYGGIEHEERQARLRRAAIRAMQVLAPFEPRLVGPVLDGTATRHSRVALHAFADSPESVVHHFLNHKEPFREEQRQIRWHNGGTRAIPIFVFDLSDCEVEVAILDLNDRRQSPPSPIDGKPQRRATIREIEELLEPERVPATSLPQAVF